MRRLRGGIVLAVLAALLVASTHAAAIRNTMDVVILTPAGALRIGDTATVEVHVFNLGVHVDPSALFVRLNSFQLTDPLLNVTRIAEGVYRASFVIQAADVAGGFIRVTADAAVGGIRDFESTWVSVATLDVEVESAAARTTPGSSVGITVRIRENGVPSDPAALGVMADVLTVGGPVESYRLGWLRTAVGTFEARFVVPTTVAQDTAVSFVAWATRGVTAVGQDVVVIDVPTKLVVWSHEVSVGRDSADLEILVANDTGWSAVGASVDLAYAYFDPSLALTLSEASGLTDERGAARFALLYPGTASNVGFWGTATHGVASQGFAGSLSSLKIKPMGGVSVLRENRDEALVAGERATATYVVAREGEPLAFQTLYYTARTSTTLVASGQAVSDASGRFALDFVVSPGSTTVEFALYVAGAWIYEHDVLLGAKRLAVDVGPLYVGATAHLSAPVPEVDVPWIAYIAFVPYRSAMGALDAPWALASGPARLHDVAISAGGAFDYDLLVPRFLPKGEDYLLSIFAFPHRPAIGPEDVYVYVKRERIENLAPSPAIRVSPTTGAAGSAVEVDASASFDLDGVVEAYEVSWGDGAATGWTAAPVASHVYAMPGDYAATVRVRDNDGAVGQVEPRIRVDAGPASAPPLLRLPAMGAIALVALVLLWRWAYGVRLGGRAPRGRSRRIFTYDRRSGRPK